MSALGPIRPCHQQWRHVMRRTLCCTPDNQCQSSFEAMAAPTARHFSSRRRRRSGTRWPVGVGGLDPLEPGDQHQQRRGRASGICQQHVALPGSGRRQDEQSGLSPPKSRTPPLSAAALSMRAQARRTDREAAGCCAYRTQNAKISCAGMDGTKRLNLGDATSISQIRSVFGDRPALQAAARLCSRGSAGGECGNFSR